MRRYTITVNDVTRVIDVEALTADTYRVGVNGRILDVRLDDHRGLAQAAIAPTIEVRRTTIGAEAAAVGQTSPTAGGAKPGDARGQSAPASRADKMTAPMPGVILSVLTRVGAPVRRGEAVAILEAMKMKNELKATRDGVVAELYVADGQQVRFGEALLRLEEQ